MTVNETIAAAILNSRKPQTITATFATAQPPNIAKPAKCFTYSKQTPQLSE